MGKTADAIGGSRRRARGFTRITHRRHLTAGKRLFAPPDHRIARSRASDSADHGHSPHGARPSRVRSKRAVAEEPAFWPPTGKVGQAHRPGLISAARNCTGRICMDAAGRSVRIFGNPMAPPFTASSNEARRARTITTDNISKSVSSACFWSRPPGRGSAAYRLSSCSRL
jgi:hypothetical protein